MKALKVISVVLAAFALAFLVPAGVASAQQPQSHRMSNMPPPASVKLVLQDSSSGEPVPFATISLSREGSQKPSKYVLSEEDGSAKLERVRPGKYILTAELLGFKAYKTTVEVKGELDLGVLKMDPDREMLASASVSAAGNPIIMKKDTVEYNATSFKTTDNDMLEDLLKKLPGVEISEDGTVTHNGKTISKITIAGKTFFLDDPQLATKNIPAKIIEKVKVVDQKSEQARFTGIDDGDEETVIDLSIMPNMMNGLFGNVMGGGGHDWLKSESGESFNTGDGDYRYQGAAFIGKFTDKTQLGVILNGNNTNNRGFNDMAGSMMQGMRGGGGGMGRRQGGWGAGNGITTSWMGGLNGNFTLFDDKMELGPNYLFNATKKHVIEQSVKTTHMDDYDLIYNVPDGVSNTNSYGHRLGARIDHKFSDKTSILFQPQFHIGKGDYREFNSFDTYADYLDGSPRRRVNDGFKNSTGDNNSMQANGFLLLRQRLGKPGRTMSAFFRYDLKTNDLDGFNQSLTKTYDGELITDTDIVNQRFDQKNRQYSLSGRITYTEPLAKHFFFEANYGLSWSKNTSDKKTYTSGGDPVFTPEQHDYERAGEEPDPRYSNTVLNRYINQTIGGTFVYQKDKFNAQVGLNANPTNTHNETNGKTYDNKVMNWAPSARMWFDIGENTTFRLFYWGRTSQPSTSQLMAVPDNSDPLNVSFGNPFLKPYFNHNFRSEFRLTNKRTFTSVSVNLDGGFVHKPIVNASWAGINGVQYALPVNGPDSFNGNMRIFVNSPIAKSNFSIFAVTRLSYSKSSSFVGKSALDMSPYIDPVTAEFDYNKFFTDFPDLSESDAFVNNTIKTFSGIQRIRLTYRNDFIEVMGGGRVGFNKSWYTQGTSNLTWRNQLDGSINLTLPKGFNVVTDVRYNWYRGYSVDQDSETILNAQISKTILKNAVTLSLKAYDLLNQGKNLSITDSANYHQETLNNTLGRYVMFSVTFRFGDFGNLKNAKGGMRGFGGGRGGRGGFRR